MLQPWPAWWEGVCTIRVFNANSVDVLCNYS